MAIQIKNKKINELYELIKNNYCFEININNFNPNDYISYEHFLKILCINYLKNDRHFNIYKPLNYYEVPIGRINKYGNGYIYMPRTDYYITRELLYEYINNMHYVIITMAKNGVRNYILDLRCNSGGLIILFMGCVLPFIRSRGLLMKGINKDNEVKYEYHLEDDRFYACNESNIFVELQYEKRDINPGKIKVNEIIKYNTKFKPTEHIRNYKSIIANDFVPETETYENIKIGCPNIDFDSITILVDCGTGSAAEYLTSIFKAENAQIFGTKTIGILSQNQTYHYEQTLIILPVCYIMNAKGEIFKNGITPEISEIPKEYLPN